MLPILPVPITAMFTFLVIKTSLPPSHEGGVYKEEGIILGFHYNFHGAFFVMGKGFDV